jgi:hypothetical protein
MHGATLPLPHMLLWTRTGWYAVGILAEERDFLFCGTSRLSLGFTQPLPQWLPGYFPPRIKGRKCDVDNSSPLVCLFLLKFREFYCVLSHFNSWHTSLVLILLLISTFSLNLLPYPSSWPPPLTPPWHLTSTPFPCLVVVASLTMKVCGQPAYSVYMFKSSLGLGLTQNYVWHFGSYIQLHWNPQQQSWASYYIVLVRRFLCSCCCFFLTYCLTFTRELVLQNLSCTCLIFMFFVIWFILLIYWSNRLFTSYLSCPKHGAAYAWKFVIIKQKSIQCSLIVCSDLFRLPKGVLYRKVDTQLP